MLEAHPHKLTRYERIKSRTSLDRLFPQKGEGVASCALVFPIKAVWRISDNDDEAVGARVMISVPKRRLHHAVDRVLMRRRIREAFRLLKPAPGEARPTRDIAFVYVASKPLAYSTVRFAVDKLLKKILG